MFNGGSKAIVFGVLVEVLVGVAGMFVMVGCGGGGKAIGGPPGRPAINLTDSQGKPLANNQVDAGRSVITSLSGLKPYTQYDIFVFGPPQTLTSTAPDGRRVTAYLRLTTDAGGQIPPTILDYDLTEGTYNLEIVEVGAGRDGSSSRQQPILQTSFQANPLAPSVPFVFIQNAQGIAIRSFAPGADVYVRGQGLPPNKNVDLYVVQDQAVWETGDPLVDLSGVGDVLPIPDLPRSSRRSRPLSGTAETVTTDANGAFPATVVWQQVPADAEGKPFDVIVDVNQNGVFDPDTDVVNDEQVVGFMVQSEMPRRQGGHIIANISVSAGTCQRKDSYYVHESVYGLINPQTRMALGGDRWVKKYVVQHRELNQWTAGTPLVDVSSPTGGSFWEADTVERGCTNEGCVLLWPANLRQGDYDIVIDVNRNDVYDPGVDILDGTDDCGTTVGFHVIGQPTAKKWTVMVYIGGDNNLESPAIEDINEMEQVGSNDDINIVVQFDRHPGYDTSNGDWTTTRRYYITRDADANTINSNLICDLGEVNMGDPNTLQDFITWAKAHYPANRYALILWNHGSGFRSRISQLISRNIVWDDTNGNASLSLPQVAQAISGAGGVNFVGFDACLMGMVETAVQIGGLADFMAASEDLEPGDGWEYHEFLARLVANPNMTPQQLATEIVNAYRQRYQGDNDVTLSAVNLSQADNLRRAFDNLARALLEDPDGDGPQVPVVESDRNALQNARNNAQRFAEGKPYDDYRDAYHFAQLVRDAINDAEVDNACNTIINTINTAVTSEWHSADLPNAHGLTVWLPTRESFNNHVRRYTDLLFARQTLWDEFLSALWGLTMRIELTWGQEPRDLDSHLWDAAGNHLYFPYAGEGNSPIPGAWLDLDDTTSFGPENISITFFTPQDGNLYTYAVHLYAGEASSEISTVRVFRGSSTVPTHTFTYSGWDPNGAIWWHVFDIDPRTGNVIPRDQHLTSPPRGMRRLMPRKSITPIISRR